MQTLSFIASISKPSLPSMRRNCINSSDLEKRRKMEVAGVHERPQGIANLLASPLLSAILALSAPALTAPAPRIKKPKLGKASYDPRSHFCDDLQTEPHFPGHKGCYQRGATLFRKDLQRNGLVTDEDIYNITYYGKGRMPGFGEKCTPRGQCTFGPRLQEEEIKQLAEFVKLQSEKGWPNVETYVD